MDEVQGKDALPELSAAEDLDSRTSGATRVPKPPSKIKAFLIRHFDKISIFLWVLFIVYIGVNMIYQSTRFFFTWIVGVLIFSGLLITALLSHHSTIREMRQFIADKLGYGYDIVPDGIDTKTIPANSDSSVLLHETPIGMTKAEPERFMTQWEDLDLERNAVAHRVTDPDMPRTITREPHSFVHEETTKGNDMDDTTPRPKFTDTPQGPAETVLPVHKGKRVAEDRPSTTGSSETNERRARRAK